MLLDVGNESQVFCYGVLVFQSRNVCEGNRITNPDGDTGFSFVNQFPREHECPQPGMKKTREMKKRAVMTFKEKRKCGSATVKNK